MEPNEHSIKMIMPDVMSSSFNLPTTNTIRNVDDDDASHDILGRAEPVLRTNSNHHTKMVQVMASDLRNFVKSKEDLYVILSIEG